MQSSSSVEPVLSRGRLSHEVFQLSSAAAVSTSLALAACTSAFTLFGYDWGREILEELLKQSVSWSGTMTLLAAIANLGLIVPASYGLYSGFLLERQRPVPFVIGALLVFSLGLAVLKSLAGGSFALLFAAISGAVCVLGYATGAVVRDHLPCMPLLRKAIMPALWYLIPAGLLLLTNQDGNFGFREEVCTFSLSVFIASRVAAGQCRVRGVQAGLCAALLVSLPLLLVTGVNLAVNVLAIVLGMASTPGWQTLSSTMIVTACLSVSAAAGGVYGAWRNQSPRRITAR